MSRNIVPFRFRSGLTPLPAAENSHHFPPISPAIPHFPHFSRRSTVSLRLPIFLVFLLTAWSWALGHPAFHPFALAAVVPSGASPASAIPAASGPSLAIPTFSRDIAPILFQHCAPCHRPGQSAPFSLLTFDDAKKHAQDLALVTRTRYMPPWLPDPSGPELIGARHLSDTQIKLFQDWLAGGTTEGDPADLPPIPTYHSGWALGEPDLVVELPEAYTLAADGRDLYRNFVIPAPLKESRYVRAFEFQPRNRSVHHVRILLDPTRQSQRLDVADAEPGFPGMKTPAKFPPGHMLTWIPGKTIAPEREGLAWPLGGGVDLVLQIHFQRTGKPERIQPALALYFTNQPPTKTAFVLGLSSQLIDIPAGEKAHIEERSLTLLADVDVIGILPHLHFLGKEVVAFATLPTGAGQPLLRIDDWNFNWQDQYRYKTPVFLPAGSRITMRYTFDNSAENIRNPHQPPQRVVFGPQSTDEMAELWLQVIPRNPADIPSLQKAKQNALDLETVAFYESQLRARPGDASVHLALGKILGPMNRLDVALRHFQTAIQLQPGLAEAHYYLGLSLYTIREWDDAIQSFQNTLAIDPAYSKAHTGLGLVHLRRNQPGPAKIQFERALKLNPDDLDARQNLDRLR